MKKISVILPCYNVEKYIEECLASIEAQTIGMEYLEIVAVDNGSTDNTYELLKVFEQKHPEDVLLVHVDQNQMPGFARNTGLAYANAPYCIFVDSDDCLNKDALLDLCQLMEKEPVDVIEFDYASGPDMEHMKVQGSEDGAIDVRHIETANDRRILYGGVIKNGFVWNKLFRTAFLKDNNLFFAEGLKHEDTIFALLVYLCAKTYATYNKCYYYYRINQQGIMWSVKKDDYGQFDRCKVMLQALKVCHQRGLLEEYYDIVEAQFVSVYYVDTMAMVMDRFEVLPEREIKEMQETVKTLFPAFRQNFFLNMPRWSYTKEYLDMIP